MFNLVTLKLSLSYINDFRKSFKTFIKSDTKKVFIRFDRIFGDYRLSELLTINLYLHRLKHPYIITFFFYL